MKRKNKNLILGFGSVGLSTLSHLNKNSELQDNSTLYVKAEFEKNLDSKKNDSLSAKMKLASYQKHKKDYDTKIFGEDNLLSSSDSDDLVTKFPCETIFTIVGLGGTSGDHLLNISDILRWGESKDLVNFCIMPFNFEGTKRKKYADEQLRLIYRLPKDGLCFVLANQDLLKGANSQTTFDKAFTKFHEQIESIILKHKVKSGKSVININSNDRLGN